MARIVWSAFFSLLAFVSGSFFTGTLMLHSLQKSKSQRPADIFDGEWESLQKGAWREFQGQFVQRRGDIESGGAPNHTLRRPNPAIRKSKHSALHQPHPTEPSRPVRILCWVMTSPKTLQSRALNVRDTWGPRCDVTLYVSSQPDPDFPALGLGGVAEGRGALWNKTKAAFRYIYEHHFHDADWFMKADDDTYVIVENLRRFLQDKNSSSPIYYGHHFKTYIRQGYMSGGAGYVMSRNALERFVRELKLHKDCGAPPVVTSSAEDVTLGLCMMRSGVSAGDSRDDQNRSRFLPFDLETFYDSNLPDWYFRFAKYPIKQGRDCCSDSLISVHYVTDRISMLLLDYYIHGLGRGHS